MKRLNSILKKIETKSATSGEKDPLFRAVKGLNRALNKNDLKKAKEMVDQICKHFLD